MAGLEDMLNSEVAKVNKRNEMALAEKSEQIKELQRRAIVDMPIADIFVSANVRDTEGIDEDHPEIIKLAESILSKGLITPITIHYEKGKWVQTAGFRRLMAYRRLFRDHGQKYATIPAIKKSDKLADIDRVAIQLIENIQRVDLSDAEMRMALAEARQLDPVRFSNLNELAKELGMHRMVLTRHFTAMNFEEKYGAVVKRAQERTKETLLSRTVYDLKLQDEPEEQVVLALSITSNLSKPALELAVKFARLKASDGLLAQCEQRLNERIDYSTALETGLLQLSPTKLQAVLTNLPSFSVADISAAIQGSSAQAVSPAIVEEIESGDQEWVAEEETVEGDTDSQISDTDHDDIQSSSDIPPTTEIAESITGSSAENQGSTKDAIVTGEPEGSDDYAKKTPVTDLGESKSANPATPASSDPAPIKEPREAAKVAREPVSPPTPGAKAPANNSKGSPAKTKSSPPLQKTRLEVKYQDIRVSIAVEGAFRHLAESDWNELFAEIKRNLIENHDK
jgi:ParB/RepB/Spo0J family partition protein